MNRMRVNYSVEQREQQREIMRSRIFSFSFFHCFGEVLYSGCDVLALDVHWYAKLLKVYAQQPNNGTNIYKNKIIIASTQNWLQLMLSFFYFEISIRVFSCIAARLSKNVLKYAGI